MENAIKGKAMSNHHQIVLEIRETKRKKEDAVNKVWREISEAEDLIYSLGQSLPVLREKKRKLEVDAQIKLNELEEERQRLIDATIDELRERFNADPNYGDQTKYRFNRYLSAKREEARYTLGSEDWGLSQISVETHTIALKRKSNDIENYINEVNKALDFLRY